MATVINESFLPPPKSDPLFVMLLTQSIKDKQRREAEQRKSEAAGSAAQALSQLLEGPETGQSAALEEPGVATPGDPMNPDAVQQFLMSSVAAGGNPSAAARTVVGINTAKTQEEKDLLANQALLELGEPLLASSEPRQRFAGKILSKPGLKPSTKTAIINQTGVLFPETDSNKMKDVALFDDEGNQDLVRVPKDVGNPQEYIEKEFPELVAAGFSTRKPRLAKETKPTEGDKNVTAVVQQNPVLQRLLGENKITQSEARNRARLALREREGVLKQIRADFGESIEAGKFQLEASPKNKIMFELARSNITSIFAEGITDPGQVVKVAKDVAERQFNNLRWLPEQLQLNPQTAKDMDHVVSVIRFLMNDDPASKVLSDDAITDEERFDEAMELVKNRLNISEKAEKEIRETILGKPKEEPKEEDGGFLERFLK